MAIALAAGPYSAALARRVRSETIEPNWVGQVLGAIDRVSPGAVATFPDVARMLIEQTSYVVIAVRREDPVRVMPAIAKSLGMIDIDAAIGLAIPSLVPVMDPDQWLH